MDKRVSLNNISSFKVSSSALSIPAFSVSAKLADTHPFASMIGALATIIAIAVITDVINKLIPLDQDEFEYLGKTYSTFEARTGLVVATGVIALALWVATFTPLLKRRIIVDKRVLDLFLKVLKVVAILTSLISGLLWFLDPELLDTVFYIAFEGFLFLSGAYLSVIGWLIPADLIKTIGFEMMLFVGALSLTLIRLMYITMFPP